MRWPYLIYIFISILAIPLMQCTQEDNKITNRDLENVLNNNMGILDNPPTKTNTEKKPSSLSHTKITETPLESSSMKELFKNAIQNVYQGSDTLNMMFATKYESHILSKPKLIYIQNRYRPEIQKIHSMYHLYHMKGSSKESGNQITKMILTNLEEDLHPIGSIGANTIYAKQIHIKSKTDLEHLLQFIGSTNKINDLFIPILADLAAYKEETPSSQEANLIADKYFEVLLDKVYNYEFNDLNALNSSQVTPDEREKKALTERIKTLEEDIQTKTGIHPLLSSPKFIQAMDKIRLYTNIIFIEDNHIYISKTPVVQLKESKITLSRSNFIQLEPGDVFISHSTQTIIGKSKEETEKAILEDKFKYVKHHTDILKNIWEEFKKKLEELKQPRFQVTASPQILVLIKEAIALQRTATQLMREFEIIKKRFKEHSHYTKYPILEKYHKTLVPIHNKTSYHYTHLEEAIKELFESILSRAENLSNPLIEEFNQMKLQNIKAKIAQKQNATNQEIRDIIYKHIQPKIKFLHSHLKSIEAINKEITPFSKIETFNNKYEDYRNRIEKIQEQTFQKSVELRILKRKIAKVITTFTAILSIPKHNKMLQDKYSIFITEKTKLQQAKNAINASNTATIEAAKSALEDYKTAKSNLENAIQVASNSFSISENKISQSLNSLIGQEIKNENKHLKTAFIKTKNLFENTKKTNESLIIHTQASLNAIESPDRIISLAQKTLTTLTQKRTALTQTKNAINALDTATIDAVKTALKHYKIALTNANNTFEAIAKLSTQTTSSTLNTRFIPLKTQFDSFKTKNATLESNFQNLIHNFIAMHDLLNQGQLALATLIQKKAALLRVKQIVDISDITLTVLKLTFKDYKTALANAETLFINATNKANTLGQTAITQLATLKTQFDSFKTKNATLESNFQNLIHNFIAMHDLFNQGQLALATLIQKKTALLNGVDTIKTSDIATINALNQKLKDYKTAFANAETIFANDSNQANTLSKTEMKQLTTLKGQLDSFKSKNLHLASHMQTLVDSLIPLDGLLKTLDSKREAFIEAKDDINASDATTIEALKTALKEYKDVFTTAQSLLITINQKANILNKAELNPFAKLQDKLDKLKESKEHLERDYQKAIDTHTPHKANLEQEPQTPHVLNSLHPPQE